MRQTAIISATELHKHRGLILKRCFREKLSFIVEKDGIPMVAIIPIDHYQTLIDADMQLDHADFQRNPD